MHKSVLLESSIDALQLKSDSIIIDCTLGYAGHSSEILKRIPDGKLYAFDQDMEAIVASEKRLKEIGDNYEIIRSNFIHLKEELDQREIGHIDGILFDLGVSSPQLDEGERGFSFHKDAKLDMRMDLRNQLTAYQVVNEYSYAELVRIFIKYGEEKFSTSIARNIVKARQEKPIETTLALAEIIKASVPEKYRREKHPARKVFQAIRIEVNDELYVFEQALKQALSLISVGGRICVITFHSLEDRICKRIMNEVSKVKEELKDLPVIPEQYCPKFQMIDVIEPTEQEKLENHRARSAKLRVIERIKG